ncbi:MAG: Fe-S oxidoreductase [Actinomycetia bacterium]|nr:Fe-S oxidoreductase [Actinomycetes bacterium]
MGMPPARVLAVAPGSPAAHAGLEAGDEILSVNGEDLRDVIRYQIQADEPVVELELRRGGLEQLLVVEKAAGEPLGAELESAVFDRVRTCDNHCPFCFIYQLPKGMRKSLYMKDDDYRLSFLYGNFTTLTRFTEADLERVVTEGLGPLYVSIHATDPEVRTQLLRNRRGATSLRWLAALLDAGIEVHGQVVVCPGVNDGDVLDDTMLGLLDRFPKLASVGVVPLGVSSHSREDSMRPHTVEEAQRVVEIIEAWQLRFRSILGHRLVYAADEYYLMAGRPFPPAAEYESFAQHENGIGMARTFTTEVRAALDGNADGPGTGPRSGFFSWVEGAPAEGYRAPRTIEPVAPPAPDLPAGSDGPVRVTLRPSRTAPVVIITGTYGQQVLAPLLDELTKGTGTQIRLLPVANAFFGGNIGVTGLLTASDVSAALASQPEGRRYLLPDVVLSNGVFLDGGTVDDLPRPVEIVPTDGVSLVAALRAGSKRLVPA